MYNERLQFTIVDSDSNKVDYVFTIAELQKMYLKGDISIKDTDKISKCLVGNIPLYVDDFGELTKVLGINKDSYIEHIKSMFKKYSLEELEHMYTKEQIIEDMYIPVYGFRPLSSYNKHRILHEIYMMFYSKDRATDLLSGFDN